MIIKNETRHVKVIELSDKEVDLLTVLLRVFLERDSKAATKYVADFAKVLGDELRK